MRGDDKVLPVAEGDPGSHAKGALGVLMIGVACVVCCLPPVVAFGGVALGVAAGAGGWLVGLPTAVIAALVVVPILIVLTVLARPVLRRAGVWRNELHRLS